MQVVITREEEEDMMSDSSEDEDNGDGGLSSIIRTRIRGQSNVLELFQRMSEIPS